MYPPAGDSPWTGVAEPGSDEEGSGVRRYVVANVEVKVASERVQYFDATGRLITESLKDYTRKALAKEFSSLDDFLRRWNDADKKQAIIDELANEGVFFEALAEEIGKQSGKEFDPFDLVCHIVWDQPPLTRKERAEQVKKRDYFTKYGDQAQRVLQALLDKYADEGIGPIEETQILTIAPFTSFGTPMEIIRAFGGLDKYQHAVQELEQALYFATDDRYTLYFDIANIRQEFADLSTQELFRQFDNLKTLGMLGDISIPLTLTSGLNATIDHFSDGQFQSIYIYSIVELFNDRNCLILLDEPDAFLHPEWQFDFLRQVFDITNAAEKTSHILMSSHSAATLCHIEDQQINLFRIENSAVSCCRRSKKDVISELSNSFIQYSEDESRLLIDNVIRSSSRPILFVEGPSDVSILNTAYKKLYPNEDISILVQDAFDRGFIKVLFARNEVFATYPDKQLFALFDFDDAYDDWRDLGGVHQVTDIGLGLTRKLDGKNAYTFLLPVPENQLRDQVWDDANPIEKIKPHPHYCIEHIFWGVHGLDDWFRSDSKSGAIRFKGDKHKVKFAKEVVPTLSAPSFEYFRPIFEFIKSKCAGGSPA